MRKGRNRPRGRGESNGGGSDDVDVGDGDRRVGDETTMNRVSTTAPTTTRDETFTSAMVTTVHSSTSTSVTSRTTPLLSTEEIPTSTFALQSVPPRDDTQTGPNVVILVTLPAVLLVVIVLLVIWSIRKKSIVRLQQRRNPVYPTDSDGVNMKGMEASPADQYEEVNENIPKATESTKKTTQTTPFYQTLEPDIPALNGIVTSHKDVAYDQLDRDAHSRMIDNENINRAAVYDRVNLTSESTSYDILNRDGKIGLKGGVSRLDVIDPNEYSTLSTSTSLVSPSYDKLKRTEGQVNDRGEANSNNSSNQNRPQEEYGGALRRAEYNHTVPWYDRLNATNSGSGISYE